MDSPPYRAEYNLALAVTRIAALLTKSVLRSLGNNVGAETKVDDSPVTIADFAAQAVLISALHAVYPQDHFIGEESADALRQNEALAERVWQLVLRAKEDYDAREDKTSDVQSTRESAEVMMTKFPGSKEEMLDLIDLGKGGVTGQGRVWVMDPVDGTATFMQGQQYAVALCLLVDGVQEVGVVACPNLALDGNSPLGQTRIHENLVDDKGYGVVLAAMKGLGTQLWSMHEANCRHIRRIDLLSLPAKSLADLNFVDATIGKTSLSQPEHKAVAEHLGTTWPGTVIWSQQMKYVALALGATDVMVRIPKNKERYTYIWDHAGGHLLYQEAGGQIRDFDGKVIEFGRGRQIKGEVNYGMIGAMPAVFGDVDKAVKVVLARRVR